MNKKEPHVMRMQDAAELYWNDIIVPNMTIFMNELEKVVPIPPSGKSSEEIFGTLIKTVWKRGFHDALYAVERHVIIPISHN